MQTLKLTNTQKEYSVGDLNFLIKGASNCDRNQKKGLCAPSSSCLQCKWGIAMGTIYSLDKLTQARIKDKADILSAWENNTVEASQKAVADEKKRERNLKIGICVIISEIIAFITIMQIVGW